MSTTAQVSYISDLTVIKTKEFKEVKELLIAHNIVANSSATVTNAATISDICNALTDLQASKFIDVLVATKQPQRSTAYAPARVQKTIDLLEGIKKTVDDWTFM